MLVLCLGATLACAPVARAAAQDAAQNAAPAALSLDAYAAALARCAGEMTTLRVHPDEIAAYRAGLPDAWRVRAEGKTFAVPTGWLDTALAGIQMHPKEAAPVWREIGRRLNFLEGQATALERPAARPTTREARAELAGIFRREEFRGLSGPGPIARWWHRVTAWVGERIEALIARLHLGKFAGNDVAYVLMGVVLVLLALWLWRSLAGRSRELEAEFEAPARVRDTRAWLGEAIAAAGRGEYREAIHCGYWAAVAHLEQLGAVTRDRTRTPRELVRVMEARAGERGPLRELTARFERAWYGRGAPTAADWENVKTELERMGCPGFSTAKTAGS